MQGTKFLTTLLKNCLLPILKWYLVIFNMKISEMRQMAELQKSVIQNNKQHGKGFVIEETKNIFLEDNQTKYFCCKKEDIGKALINFGIGINKWKSNRNMEQEEFIGSFYTHLIEVIRNLEKIILQQAQEKRDYQAVRNFVILDI